MLANGRRSRMALIVAGVRCGIAASSFSVAKLASTIVTDFPTCASRRRGRRERRGDDHRQNALVEESSISSFIYGLRMKPPARWPPSSAIVPGANTGVAPVKVLPINSSPRHATGTSRARTRRCRGSAARCPRPPLDDEHHHQPTQRRDARARRARCHAAAASPAASSTSGAICVISSKWPSSSNSRPVPRGCRRPEAQSSSFRTLAEHSGVVDHERDS